VDLNFEPQKIKILQHKRLVGVHILTNRMSELENISQKLVHCVSFYLAQYFKICSGQKNIIFI